MDDERARGNAVVNTQAHVAFARVVRNRAREGRLSEFDAGFALSAPRPRERSLHRPCLAGALRDSETLRSERSRCYEPDPWRRSGDQ